MSPVGHVGSLATCPGWVRISPGFSVDAVLLVLVLCAVLIRRVQESKAALLPLVSLILVESVNVAVLHHSEFMDHVHNLSAGISNIDSRTSD